MLLSCAWLSFHLIAIPKAFSFVLKNSKFKRIWSFYWNLFKMINFFSFCFYVKILKMNTSVFCLNKSRYVPWDCNGLIYQSKTTNMSSVFLWNLNKQFCKNNSVFHWYNLVKKMFCYYCVKTLKNDRLETFGSFWVATKERIFRPIWQFTIPFVEVGDVEFRSKMVALSKR